jgi:hypothetical protein
LLLAQILEEARERGEIRIRAILPDRRLPGRT